MNFYLALKTFNIKSGGLYKRRGLIEFCQTTKKKIIIIVIINGQGVESEGL
jgi:hypothetical protein